MSTSIIELTVKLPIALLRTWTLVTGMLVAGPILALSWSATSALAADPNDPHLVCGEVCYPPSTRANALYLPVLTRGPQPTSPHAVVVPQPVWSADWWQWLERMANMPLVEQGNVDCSQGQSGSVWFLAGANDNLPKTRNCAVPTTKTLLAPLFTIAFYNTPGEPYSLEEKQKHLDEAFSDEVRGMFNTELCRLESTINGTPVNGARLKSPPFTAQGDPEAISDGFWLAFQLAPGIHQVQFAGALCEFGTGIEAHVVDITYNLVVTE